MAYNIHRGSVILDCDKRMYIGIKHPTSAISQLRLKPKREAVIETFESTNLKELRKMVNGKGMQLSREDNIPYVSNF
jgi:hypothetical protein